MLDTAQAGSTEDRISSGLIGVWTLLSYSEEKAESRDRHPFGLTPHGFLIYTSDGFVSAQLMRPGRTAFQSRDWQQGTPKEYVESASGYIAYCGTYEVDETSQTVTHIPSVALLPNLIQGRQLRSFQLNGDRLSLRTVGCADIDGAPITSHLEWRRAVRLSESM
jgi:hypothetical protein